MLETALAHAARGWAVFPCNDKKRPLTPNGFKDATTDPEQIRQWFTQFPDALIGSPTGNGLLVVDLDRKNGIDGWETWVELQQVHSKAPDTYSVLTRTGGIHLYFTCPPGFRTKSSAGKLGIGVDIRGDGGYRILPGSAGYEVEGSSTETIALAPMWLLQMVGREAEQKDATTPAEEPGERFDVRAATSAILSGSPLHDSLRGLAAHLSATGVATDAAIEILRGLMDHSRARYDRPEEWQDRRDDIPRLVWSAVRFAPDEEIDQRVPTADQLGISADEWHLSSLTPKCIVRNHTYADVATVVAPGGTGKTTLLLYESVLIALGRPVWGNAVENPGPTLIITAEDERERLIARLREICKALNLTDFELARIRKDIIIWDITGQQKKLVFVHDGNLSLTPLADDIIEAFKDKPPAVVLFDPMVSFGAAEERTNDNEQAIITACRRIVRGLGCCVRLVHHTGKANAREKNLDQYSGRGGSALADGSRMTTVLATWEPGTKSLTPPPGVTYEKDSSLVVLSRAKLSYAPPNLPLIWIKRTGFAFDYMAEIVVSREEKMAAEEAQVLQFLKHELRQGRHWTKSELEDNLDALSMSRAVLRRVLAALTVAGRIAEAELPAEERRGRRTHFLQPIG